MNTQHKINPLFKVFDDSRAVIFRNQHRYIVLEGNEVREVVNRIKEGVPSQDDLVRSLAPTLTQQQTISILHHLLKDGLAGWYTSAMTTQAAQFWSQWGVSLDIMQQRLAKHSVILSTDGIQALEFKHQLGQLGIQFSKDGDLGVFITSRFESEVLNAFNRQAIQSGRPWILGGPGDHSVFIAPFQPGVTPCWVCLKKRLRANKRLDQYLESIGIQNPIQHPPFFPGLDAQIKHHVLLQIAQWFTGKWDVSSVGSLTEIDVRQGHEKTHAFTASLSCEHCQNRTDTLRLHTSSPVFKRQRKASGLNNGLRVVSPEEAFERYQHLISEQTGFFRDLTRISSTSKHVTFTYTLQHALLSRIDTLPKLRASEWNQSSGKGSNEIEAKCSALYEGAERRAGVWRPSIPTRLASWSQLGDNVPHPDNLLLFSESQYANRDTWNKRIRNPMLYVPDPFDEQEEIHWVDAWNLTDDQPTYLPAMYAYYDAPVSGRTFCIPNSNGCASGYVMEEAIIQAVLEIIERDSVSLYWYNTISRPAVCMDSFENPYVNAVRAYYESIGRNLWVLDVTGPLGIPTFVAVSCKKEGRPAYTMGFASHFDAGITLVRCLTESNQMLPLMEQGAAFPENHEGWVWDTPLDTIPFLAPDNNRPALKSGQFTTFQSNFLDDYVHHLIGLFKQQNLDLILHDQTNPDMDVPVVRMSVPGMYHYWRRFGGKRLYSDPRDMQWITHPRREEELNTLSLVF